MSEPQFRVFSKLPEECPIKKAIWLLWGATLHVEFDMEETANKILFNAMSHLLKVDDFFKHKEIICETAPGEPTHQLLRRTDAGGSYQTD